jgi:thiol-disulfide isomerase/thioredoxin
MRAPVDTIAAPPFPPDLEWVNVAPLRMDKQIGRPVLVEFWDFCRPNSLRTLPYLKAWHERYAGDGLRVIGIHTGGFLPAREPENVIAATERLGIEYPVVIDERLELWDFYGNEGWPARYAGDGLRVISVHTPGFAASRDEAAVRDAVARLGIQHPVCIDSDGLVWSLYDNEGWPARYLFNRSGRLHEFHFGEGAYAETEVAIQELLGVEREPLRALRPEDEPSARIVVPSADVAGPYSGPYVAGTVWAILAGRGEVRANGRTIAVEHPGAYELVSHPLSTEGVLDLAVGPGVECLGVCFSPGLAPPGA